MTHDTHMTHNAGGARGAGQVEQERQKALEGQAEEAGPEGVGRGGGRDQ